MKYRCPATTFLEIYMPLTSLLTVVAFAMIIASAATISLTTAWIC